MTKSQKPTKEEMLTKLIEIAVGYGYKKTGRINHETN